MRSSRVAQIVSVAVIAGCVGGRAQAAPPSEVAALSHIRALIVAADRDYKGHKQAALHAIEDACAALNLQIHGNARGHTLQGDSDKMLQQALQEITNLQPVAEQNHQDRVISDLDKASKQLHKALDTK